MSGSAEKGIWAGKRKSEVWANGYKNGGIDALDQAAEQIKALSWPENPDDEWAVVHHNQAIAAVLAVLAELRGEA